MTATHTVSTAPAAAGPARSTDPTAGVASSTASRVLSLLYGATVYVAFLATFTYLIGFVAGAVVPKHIDSGAVVPLSEALLVNGAFLALFAVQHAIMARPAFKRRWTRIVPRHLERSTFVLVTITILGAMAWQWRPMPAVVWHLEGAAAVVLWSLCAVGWLTVLAATFLIDHFELFGLRQVVSHFLGRRHQEPRFVERALYKVVRHPLMTGFLIAFWCTPHMTVGHLFFAVMCTAYIFVGVKIEERTLVFLHGDAYRDYRRRVPGILPLPRKSA